MAVIRQHTNAAQLLDQPFDAVPTELETRTHDQPCISPPGGTLRRITASFSGSSAATADLSQCTPFGMNDPMVHTVSSASKMPLPSTVEPVGWYCTTAWLQRIAP
jgi:hypothetical protein